MKCLKPIYIDNPRYDAYKTNSERPKMAVPCGRCPSCIRNDAQQWRVRLQQEFRLAPYSFFVTLTYSDENLPIREVSLDGKESRVVYDVSKRDVQLFLKRFRKFLSSRLSSEDYKARYYLVSEYGPNTFRPHYHAIIFSSFGFRDELSVEHKEVYQAIQRCWNLGYVDVSKCNQQRIAYVTKYMSCKLLDLPKYLLPPFRLMSRRPGIGSSYLDNENVLDWHRTTLSNFIQDGDFKLPMPRYYRDKIFDDAMKEDIRDIAISVSYEQEEKLKEMARNLHIPLHELRSKLAERYVSNFFKKYTKTRKDV